MEVYDSFSLKKSTFLIASTKVTTVGHLGGSGGYRLYFAILPF